MKKHNVDIQHHFNHIFLALMTDLVGSFQPEAGHKQARQSPSS